MLKIKPLVNIDENTLQAVTNAGISIEVQYS